MPAYSETLHDLNQRYKDAWDRAERLQAELDHIQRSRAYRLFTCWRRLAACWRGAAGADQDGSLPFPCEYVDDRRVPAAGTVSILVPFKNRLDLLRNCLRGVRRGTYRRYEIVLLDNGSTCPRTLRYLEQGQSLGRFRVIRCPGSFNFSRVCNAGARQAAGDFLLFLNNDVEALSANWLDELLQLAGCPTLGVVGATLLYPNNTLQHAGIFPEGDTARGLHEQKWRHRYRGMPHDHPGDRGELLHARTVPAVTGACLMIGRSLFSDLGGFDEAHAVTLNDVDLCCRVRARGLRVAIDPRARLWHFESISRGFSREP